MATLDDLGSSSTDGATSSVAQPLLYDGQLLDQPRFHELYLLMPEDFRAELIDGVVYVSSSVNSRHGRPFASLNGLLYVYSIETPGTIVQGDTTAKLGPRNEVQPDCSLLIDPYFGGQTVEDAKGYTTGSPELVVEVAVSTLKIDLNAKKKVYEEAGAREYLVYDEPHQTFHWFAMEKAKFVPLLNDEDGLYRSKAFPGLWLDPEAFLRNDGLAVLATLRRGIASLEHVDFVEGLRRNRANRP